MKHQKKRISKIIDELMTYLYSMGATDITVNFMEEEKQFKIHIKSDYKQDCHEKIDKLLKYMKMEKQEEMEEYFWELAGDSDIGTELTLVGMMTDKKEVHLKNNIIEITLYKFK